MKDVTTVEMDGLLSPFTPHTHAHSHGGERSVQPPTQSPPSAVHEDGCVLSTTITSVTSHRQGEDHTNDG